MVIFHSYVKLPEGISYRRSRGRPYPLQPLEAIFLGWSDGHDSFHWVITALSDGAGQRSISAESTERAFVVESVHLSILSHAHAMDIFRTLEPNLRNLTTHVLAAYFPMFTILLVN